MDRSRKARRPSREKPAQCWPRCLKRGNFYRTLSLPGCSNTRRSSLRDASKVPQRCAYQTTVSLPRTKQIVNRPLRFYPSFFCTVDKRNPLLPLAGPHNAAFRGRGSGSAAPYQPKDGAVSVPKAHCHCAEKKAGIHGYKKVCRLSGDRHSIAATSGPGRVERHNPPHGDLIHALREWPALSRHFSVPASDPGCRGHGTTARPSRPRPPKACQGSRRSSRRRDATLGPFGPTAGQSEIRMLAHNPYGE